MRMELGRYFFRDGRGASRLAERRAPGIFKRDGTRIAWWPDRVKPTVERCLHVISLWEQRGHQRHLIDAEEVRALVGSYSHNEVPRPGDVIRMPIHLTSLDGKHRVSTTIAARCVAAPGHPPAEPIVRQPLRKLPRKHSRDGGLRCELCAPFRCRYAP